MLRELNFLSLVDRTRPRPLPNGTNKSEIAAWDTDDYGAMFHICERLHFEMVPSFLECQRVVLGENAVVLSSIGLDAKNSLDQIDSRKRRKLFFR